MNITRNNYEAFFVLYADNEMTAAERKEVEAFTDTNPDLQHELVLFQQFKLKPDAAVVFADKQLLMKEEQGELHITLENCENLFVLYADDELTNNEKAAVENFVYHNPRLQEEFELLQQVKLDADTNIVFENKESLYRKENDDKVIPFRWWRLAAAAIVLLLAGLFWLFQPNKNIPREAVVKKVQSPIITQQPSLQKTTATAVTGNGIKHPAGQVALPPDDANDNKQVSMAPVAHAAATAYKKQSKQRLKKILQEQDPGLKENIAGNGENKLKGIIISPAGNPPVKVDMKDVLIAAADKPLTNQQVTILNANENNKTQLEQVFPLNEDKVEVLNTSFSRKNSLKGFLRKASRMIAKNTSSGDEDGSRKGILIGGFEIALQ